MLLGEIEFNNFNLYKWFNVFSIYINLT
jgi:hypothetical protein